MRASEDKTIPDPLNGEPFISYPTIGMGDRQPFIDSLRRVPKTGLHNPLKNPERYLLYGAVSARMAEEMRKPEASSHPLTDCHVDDPWDGASSVAAPVRPNVTAWLRDMHAACPTCIQGRRPVRKSQNSAVCDVS